MSDHTDDELSIDFTDVEGVAGFTALPNGQYLLQVVDWELAATKGGPDAKLPEGTPGLKFEFDVVENEEYADRKLWNTFWLAASSLPYLKGFLAATGEFTTEELDGPLGNARELGDRVVASEARVTANVVKQKNNPQYNNISAFLPASEYKGPAAKRDTSMMP